MDIIEMAKEAMKDGVDWFARGKAAETEIKSFAKAQAYAAIAQAEQLKRIADYIEGYAAIYLDPAVVNVANERNGK